MSKAERTLRISNLGSGYSRQELLEQLQKAGKIESIITRETECQVTYESESECGYALVYHGMPFGPNNQTLEVYRVSEDDLFQEEEEQSKAIQNEKEQENEMEPKRKSENYNEQINNVNFNTESTSPNQEEEVDKHKEELKLQHLEELDEHQVLQNLQNLHQDKDILKEKETQIKQNKKQFNQEQTQLGYKKSDSLKKYSDSIEEPIIEEKPEQIVESTNSQSEPTLANIANSIDQSLRQPNIQHSNNNQDQQVIKEFNENFIEVQTHNNTNNNKIDNKTLLKELQNISLPKKVSLDSNDPFHIIKNSNFLVIASALCILMTAFLLQ